MYVDTKETAFIQDLRQPSLRALSYILRHREHWPAGFRWNYSRCQSCAMGMAHRLWNEVDDPNTLTMALTFDMPIESAQDIFVNSYLCNLAARFGYSEVTPEMVAFHIDNYLAGLA